MDHAHARRIESKNSFDAYGIGSLPRAGRADAQKVFIQFGRQPEHADAGAARFTVDCLHAVSTRQGREIDRAITRRLGEFQDLPDPQGEQLVPLGD